MAQSATGTLNEVVLSDKDFEHANSVRLLLDLLVYGVVGRKISRKSYPLDHIPDVVDLTLKYDCRCGYEHCISYIDLAFSRSPPTHFLRACEMFVLGGQLDEIRVATTVVRALAELQVKYNNPQYMGWEMRDAALVPPEYLWALSHALYPNLRSPPSFPSPDDAVQVFEDLLATFKGMSLSHPSSLDTSFMLCRDAYHTPQSIARPLSGGEPRAAEHRNLGPKYL